MKILITIIVLSISLQFLSAQNRNEIRDVSKDGKSINIYTKGAPVEDVQTSSRLTAPFGTAPDWQAKRDRQVGGLAWGDFDNDGDLDLAVGCYFSNSFPPINQYETMIFRNDDGILDTIPGWVSTDMRSTTDIKWVDINGDGWMDLLAANGNESFVPSVIYMNSENGLETTPSWIATSNAWAVGASFHDVDGDGDLDLVLANQGNSVVPAKPIQIFFNNSGVLSTTPGYNSSDQMITNTVAFADIDNSSLKDTLLSIITTTPQKVVHLKHYPIYKIDSIKVNGTPTSKFSYDAANGCITFGFNIDIGDNIELRYKYIIKGDMAACKWVNYQSGIYFNNNGIMNPLPGWTVGNTVSQKGAGWADYDNDGYMDIAFGGSGNSTVIYKNNNGIMSTSPVWSSASTSTSTQDLIWGDVNNDGFPDLAVVHFGFRRTEIFMNDNGVLETTPSWTYAAESSSNAIAFGDVNGDGYLDLAIGTAREPVMVFLNTSAIPVELSSFSSTVAVNDVRLNWQTSSELNNRGFEVERNQVRSLPVGKIGHQSSVNSLDWDVIGFVDGYGTTTEVHSYSFIDKNLPDGKYQYRLKQIDFDGSYEYSKIIDADVNTITEFSLEQNYPNPFNPMTKIRYSVPVVDAYYASTTRVLLRVYDILGKEVLTLVNENKPAGNYEVDLYSNTLSSGVYIYTLTVSQNGGQLFRDSKQMLMIK